MTEEELKELKRLIEKARTMLSTKDKTPQFISFDGDELKGISIIVGNGEEFIFSKIEMNPKVDHRYIY